MSQDERNRIVHAYRFFLREVKKGDSGDMAFAFSLIRRAKAKDVCIALICDEIHEKEAEIAALKNGLNWLGSYSL